ncbi:MAG TPA: hypothetical protein VMT20_05805 [Terriglobia bacterium]|nr:hypothetical protein [Terriglobia bacterium]
MAGSGLKLARGTATQFVPVLAFVCLLGSGPCRAQDASQQPAQQQSPATSTPPAANQAPLGPVKPIGSEEQPTGTVEQTGATPSPPPDTRPLAGAQELLPTLLGSGRSYLIPSFSVWAGADSNAQITPGVTQYLTAAIPVGSVDLNYSGRRNQFNLDGGGGGVIYPTQSSDSSAFGNFTVSDFYNARRWNFLFMDRASYFPQASLGFGGIGFAGAFNTAESLGLGSGGSQMSQIFAPGQSILLGRVGTTSNNAVVQTQYFLTPTTSVTGVASFGIQHYDQAGLASSNDRLFVGSIDHQLTRTDTVSFAYNLIQYRYNGGSTAINDNVFQLGYAHRVTSRISVSLLGGPAIIYSAITGIPGTQQSWNWVGQARASYLAERGSFYLSYLHFQTPGSGLYQGANTDTASAGFSRNLTRTWTASLNLSYAHNSALVPASPSPTAASPGATNYATGIIRLDRTVGHYVKLFGVYSVQHQISGAGVVTGYTGNTLFRQIFGIGIEMHPRPLGL